MKCKFQTINRETLLSERRNVLLVGRNWLRLTRNLLNGQCIFYIKPYQNKMSLRNGNTLAYSTARYFIFFYSIQAHGAECSGSIIQFYGPLIKQFNLCSKYGIQCSAHLLMFHVQCNAQSNFSHIIVFCFSQRNYVKYYYTTIY